MVTKKLMNRLVSLLAVFLLLPLLSGAAVAAEVDPRLQAAILVKVLNYDAIMAKKPGGTIVFHLVVDGANQKGVADAFGKMSAMGGVKAAGKIVKWVKTPISQLANALSGEQAHVIYLPAGSSGATVARANQIGIQQKTAVFGSGEQMAQKGSAVAITIEGGKPKIVVNLKASVAQGMKLSAQLLRLCRIIK